MATQAECRSMRDVMKSTLKQIIMYLFWITIAALGVVLFWRVSDLTFTFVSRQTFILTRWFFWLITGLNVASVSLGIFMIICAIVCKSKELGNEIIYFSITGVAGLVLPIIEKGVLMILESYYPSNRLPESLFMVSDYLLLYLIVIVFICFIAFILFIPFNTSKDY